MDLDFLYFFWWWCEEYVHLENHHFLGFVVKLVPALEGLAGEILFTIVPQHAESALKAVVVMPAPGGGDVPGASPAALPLALLSLPLLIAVFLLLLLLITTSSSSYYYYFLLSKLKLLSQTG